MPGGRAASGKTYRSEAGLFWLIAVLALMVRGSVLWLNLSHPTPLVTLPDSGSYIGCAEGLVRHLSMVGEDGRPLWDRTPGYPALLALTFASGLAAPSQLEGVLFVQVLLSSAVAAMGARLAAAIGTWGQGLLVGTLLVLEPSSIAYSNLILTETLYAFILMGMVLAFWKWLEHPRRASLVWFAVLTSTLPLIRPVAYHLPWVLAPLIFWRAPAASRLKQAVAFVILALLPSVAWSARNYVHFNVMTLDQIGPLAKAIFAHRIELRAGVSETPYQVEVPWHRDFATGGVLPAGEAIARQESYFAEVIKAYPVVTLQELLYSGTMLIGVPDSHLQTLVTGKQLPFEEGTIRGRLQWLWSVGPILPLILIGMVVSIGGVVLLPAFGWRNRAWSSGAQACAVFIVVIIAYHLALASFVRFQGERYRVPIIPLLAIALVQGATRNPRGAMTVQENAQ